MDGHDDAVPAESGGLEGGTMSDDMEGSVLTGTWAPPGQLAPDPLTRILQLIDSRIDERLTAHAEALATTLELFATAIAELQAGEGGTAYRAWVVEEARRLQVRPGEVARRAEPS